MIYLKAGLSNSFHLDAEFSCRRTVNCQVRVAAVVTVFGAGRPPNKKDASFVFLQMKHGAGKAKSMIGEIACANYTPVRWKVEGVGPELYC
jgi:hypothetical protein